MSYELWALGFGLLKTAISQLVRHGRVYEEAVSVFPFLAVQHRPVPTLTVLESSRSAHPPFADWRFDGGANLQSRDRPRPSLTVPNTHSSANPLNLSSTITVAHVSRLQYSNRSCRVFSCCSGLSFPATNRSRAISTLATIPSTMTRSS